MPQIRSAQPRCRAVTTGPARVPARCPASWEPAPPHGVHDPGYKRLHRHRVVTVQTWLQTTARRRTRAELSTAQRTSTNVAAQTASGWRDVTTLVTTWR
eukprot:4435883-Prymnesium_polylepis.2